MTTEAEAMFEVSTYDQGLIEDNARERFGVQYGDPQARAAMLAAGLIDANAEITQKGWALLNDDIEQLEKNALYWLQATFNSARSDGHSDGALVGTVYFDPTDKRQAELIDLASQSPGRGERIDMSDVSYGDLAHVVFDGVSDFGEHILGGAIYFSHVEADVWEIIEDTLSRPASSRPGVRFVLDGLPPTRRLPRWAQPPRR